jgi:hypothetical protein
MVTLEESCGNCRFYMASPKVCRRYPPKPMIIGVEKGISSISADKPVVMAYFPNMLPTGWCGEWSDSQPDVEN